ncbi:MAG: pantoate--beta-alanine ligase [Sphingobacteriaceae bacterium]|nr:pantoate--beta-alanine ligase [Sphingobacteriaceae bacterium]
MKVIKTISELKEAISTAKASSTKTAIVPTMGALHEGHLSLISLAKQQAKLVVCTIFVNPTQFTDPKDLEKYPRPLAHDIEKLTQVNCDILFMPSVLEMYPDFPTPEKWKIDLGKAEFLLEGAFRAGHYQGVTQIVKKLFDAVEPNIAFFGQKDYQQVLMIKNMVAHFQLPIEIVSCPIVREESGLAMSSRNIHLSDEDRQKALVLFKALNIAKENFNKLSIEDTLDLSISTIAQTQGVELDYFTIADGETLEPITTKNATKIVALVAAKVGQTRLIDNMILKELD